MRACICPKRILQFFPRISWFSRFDDRRTSHSTSSRTMPWSTAECFGSPFPSAKATARRFFLQVVLTRIYVLLLHWTFLYNMFIIFSSIHLYLITYIFYFRLQNLLQNAVRRWWHVFFVEELKHLNYTFWIRREIQCAQRRNRINARATPGVWSVLRLVRQAHWPELLRRS